MLYENFHFLLAEWKSSECLLFLLSWTEWPDSASHDPFKVTVINVAKDDSLMRSRFKEAADGKGAVS